MENNELRAYTAKPAVNINNVLHNYGPLLVLCCIQFYCHGLSWTVRFSDGLELFEGHYVKIQQINSLNFKQYKLMFFILDTGQLLKAKYMLQELANAKIMFPRILSFYLYINIIFI